MICRESWGIDFNYYMSLVFIIIIVRVVYQNWFWVIYWTQFYSKWLFLYIFLIQSYIWFKEFKRFFFLNISCDIASWNCEYNLSNECAVWSHSFQNSYYDVYINFRIIYRAYIACNWSSARSLFSDRYCYK